MQHNTEQHVAIVYLVLLCFTVMVKCNPHARDIKVMSRGKINLSHDKIVDLTGVSTCRATPFVCLRHIHLSLRQGTTYPSMTSKSCSYFEHSSQIGTFQYVQSECTL